MRLKEFAPAGGGGSGNYFQALASAWYNGAFDTGSLQKGIKSKEDVERLLNRGIVAPDGVTRKYAIDYNSDFDGVVISSDDYYEHSDYDDAGGEVDSRTGQPWGPYDYMEFKDDDLDEGEVIKLPKKHRGELDDIHSCVKCGGDLQGGTYMEHKVKVCMPCKQVYLPPNTGIDQRGNKVNDQGMAEAKKKRKKKSSRSLRGYFFPGYGYYGAGESGEGGGDGGGGESINRGVAEGSEDPFGPQGRYVGDTGPTQVSTTVPRVQLRIGDRVVYKPTEQCASIEALSRDGTKARIHIPSPMGGRTFNCRTADLKALGSLRENRNLCNVCGQTPCNCTH